MRSFIVDYFLNISRLNKKLLAILVDILIVTFSIISAMILILETITFIWSTEIWILIACTIPISILALYLCGFYKNIIRYVSKDTIKIIVIGILISAIFMSFIIAFLTSSIPRSLPIIFSSFSILSLGAIRFLLQKIFNNNNSLILDQVIIYGAGSAGRQLLVTLQQDLTYNVVAFLDDDKDLQDRFILGIPVFSPDKIEELKLDYKVKTVLLAIPSAKISIRRKILENLEQFNFCIRTIPGINDLINGKATVNELKSINVLDLLGRDVISPQRKLLSKNIRDKVVLVTGAGGSIGSELCRQIVMQKPKTLILLDVSELALYNITEEIHSILLTNNFNLNFVSLLGSISDEKKVHDIIRNYSPNTIYHTAAYKHVPLIEENIIEGIKNNVFGTLNLAKLALKNNVENFILISTDKAVRPTNVMGASKRLAELICQAFAQEKSNIKYSIVRFGNVLASSGSVIPQFDKQIKSGGPLTVTHPDITRYFMTIPEAAELVIQAGALKNKMDVYILDMGEPVKILDLAHRMINLQGLSAYERSTNSKKISEGDIEIIFSGLRPGEKLYEELFIDNNIEKTEHSRIMGAKESSLDFSKLESILNDLKICCEKSDEQNALRVLRSAPINYNYSPQ